MLFFAIPISMFSQIYKDDFKILESKLIGICKNSNLLSLVKLGETAKKNTIWAVEITKDKQQKKPALFIVAGMETNQIAGVNASLKIIEFFKNNVGLDSIANLLKNNNIYIVPIANPDAFERWTTKPILETNQNSLKINNDRDFLFDEDDFEDLNNDGYITLMRVEDSTGNFVCHNEDPRIMVQNPKGKLGKYKIFTEGIDNDKDELWNEDAKMGLDPNKSFPVDFEWFGNTTGEYPMQAVEAKLLANYLFDRPEIFAVLCFNSENNLTEPYEFNRNAVTEPLINGWLENDAAVNKKISDIYKKHISNSEKSVGYSSGCFSKWVYLHTGRWSFSTPTCWVNKYKKGDSTITDSLKIKVLKDVDNADLNFLYWAESVGMKDVFVDWKTYFHSDFPGKKVEIGGFVPYSKQRFHDSVLTKSSDLHIKFIYSLVKTRAELQFCNTIVDKLDNGIFRLTTTLINVGDLPTCSELGMRTKWVHKVRTKIELNAKQKLLSGVPILVNQKLNAKESITMTWLIKGDGQMKLISGSQITGFTELKLNFK